MGFSIFILVCAIIIAHDVIDVQKLKENINNIEE
jgi:hypothetical protein